MSLSARCWKHNDLGLQWWGRQTGPLPSQCIQFSKERQNMVTKQFLIYSCNECLKRKKYRVLGDYIIGRPEPISRFLWATAISFELNVDFRVLKCQGKWGLFHGTWKANGFQYVFQPVLIPSIHPSGCIVQETWTVIKCRTLDFSVSKQEHQANK